MDVSVHPQRAAVWAGWRCSGNAGTSTKLSCHPLRPPGRFHVELCPLTQLDIWVAFKTDQCASSMSLIYVMWSVCENANSVASPKKKVSILRMRVIWVRALSVRTGFVQASSGGCRKASLGNRADAQGPTRARGRRERFPGPTVCPTRSHLGFLNVPGELFSPSFYRCQTSGSD